MAAFRVAADLGVDAFEFDVQRTADGVPVVIHDDTLDRTTTGQGRVRDATWTTVRGLDAGSWCSPDHAGERVPSLDELLGWARAVPTGLVLELKQPSPGRAQPRDDGLVPSVIDALREHDLLERTLVISFDHPSIAETLRREPRARTALLTEGPVLVDPLAPARAIPGVLGLHVRWWWISPELIAEAHEAGMHVHAWGFGHPQDPAAVRRLVEMGIDSLSADDPRSQLALLR